MSSRSPSLGGASANIFAMKGVAKNADATRERILDAAAAEFAAYGIAGARVERIALAAQSNKSLIYQYFESKENLFAVVLAQRLESVFQDVRFTCDDLGEYAASIFDFSIQNPSLMRLLAWYSLETNMTATPGRTSSVAQKVAEMRLAQNVGDLGKGFTPEFLLTLVMTIATAWTAANPFGRPIDPNYQERLDEIREQIRKLVSIAARS